ncbi:MAG: enoyl-CoA hydratase/isomerase family protein [Aeromicrobium sp.]|uniref:enoyl-CoA hydratase/isomerase family protein n=1 Tax=Aeromicrobium sp. TaxID=1871063 RepID=UPI0039E3D1F9
MSVEIERHGDIAVMTFANGDLNLYTLELHAQFDEALDRLDAAPPRALIVRASGKLVTGGVDVAQFYARKTKADTLDLYDHMLTLTHRFAALEYPTIFAAHGLTLTWGIEIALACDVLMATPRAKFGLVERVIGLTPTMGGTQRFAERAGTARAKEFVFSGDLYDAATLERWNVVNRVLEDEDFDAAVLRFADHLATGPTKAFGAAKEILRHFAAGGVAQADAHTTAIAAELFDTEDLQSGMVSFLENGPGKATFNGR